MSFPGIAANPANGDQPDSGKVRKQERRRFPYTNDDRRETVFQSIAGQMEGPCSCWSGGITLQFVPNRFLLGGQSETPIEHHERRCSAMPAAELSFDQPDFVTVGFSLHVEIDSGDIVPALFAVYSNHGLLVSRRISGRTSYRNSPCRLPLKPDDGTLRSIPLPDQDRATGGTALPNRMQTGHEPWRRRGPLREDAFGQRQRHGQRFCTR